MENRNTLYGLSGENSPKTPESDCRSNRRTAAEPPRKRGQHNVNIQKARKGFPCKAV